MGGGTRESSVLSGSDDAMQFSRSSRLPSLVRCPWRMPERFCPRRGSGTESMRPRSICVPEKSVGCPAPSEHFYRSVEDVAAIAKAPEMPAMKTTRTTLGNPDDSE